MSLIEATDSREMRAIEESVELSPPPLPACCGDLAEDRDTREVRPHVVVEVCGDARAHVGDLEEARDAVAVEHVHGRADRQH